MSFIRHKKIYRHDVQGEAEHRSSFPSDHRCDESSAGYSFVGCSPAAPTSASPAVPSFSLYSAAVQFSAANRNCPSIALSQPRGPLQRDRPSNCRPRANSSMPRLTKACAVRRKCFGTHSVRSPKFMNRFRPDQAPSEKSNIQINKNRHDYRGVELRGLIPATPSGQARRKRIRKSF